MSKENKLYSFLYKTLGPLLKKLFRVEFSGGENEPENAPFIICPNHLSNLDVFLVAACMRHRIHYMAKAELFKVPLVSGFIRALGAFPVKRGTADVSAIKNTLSVLADGECVGLYPQGTRRMKLDPRTTPVKPGIGMIEYRSKVPVLPVCIQTKKFRILPFRKTRITFGKPIGYAEFEFEKGTKNEYEHAAELVFSRITAMLVPDGDIIK